MVRKCKLLSVVFAGIFLGSITAHGQVVPNFPNRSVRIVVAYPAGGPADVNARIVAQKLSEAWSQPVVVENRVGAFGAIAAQSVARAEADGYTLLVGDSTLNINQFTQKNLPYNASVDFVPITLLSKITALLIVRSDGPATALDLIAKARANPKKLNYGAGIVTNRLAGHLFVEQAGIDVQFVPYKGSSEVAIALLNGSIDFSFDSITTNFASLQSGKLRALAKLSNVPLAKLPELQPLSVAAQLPNLDETFTWVGLVAPAGTPKSILEKIHNDVVRVYSDPTVADRLISAGIDKATLSPSEFADFYRSEATRWERVLKTGNIKID